MKRKRTFVYGMLLLLCGLVLLEICLRTFWGFGNMLLYDAHAKYEYIAKPNQSVLRFGHKVFTNDYSMRSLPISENDSCIVLGFGDSVINGGVMTDHDSLATTRVENDLRRDGFNGFRLLNISAGSWGPDNCAAYLEENGSFGAKMIVLMVSSHDARDNMTFDSVVGVHPSYPDRQYPLALVEVTSRYILPRLFDQTKGTTGDTLLISKHGTQFNPGFAAFDKFSRENDIPLVIALHAEKSEVAQRKYNWQGQEILSFCREHNIDVINGLDIGETDMDYRDDIHLNEAGQRRWAAVLSSTIKKKLSQCR